MKVVMDHRYNYKKLEFCCAEMGALVMNKRLDSFPHTDHYPRFFVNLRNNKGEFTDKLFINYCPNCGSEVEGKLEKEN